MKKCPICNSNMKKSDLNPFYYCSNSKFSNNPNILDYTNSHFRYNSLFCIKIYPYCIDFENNTDKVRVFIYRDKLSFEKDIDYDTIKNLKFKLSIEDLSNVDALINKIKVYETFK